MNSDLKSMGIWASYVLILVVTFISIHHIRQVPKDDSAPLPKIIEKPQPKPQPPVELKPQPFEKPKPQTTEKPESQPPGQLEPQPVEKSKPQPPVQSQPKMQPHPQLKSPPKPPPFTIQSADERFFKGQVLVALVLTQGLTQSELEGIQATLDQAEKKGWRDRLMGGTVFVLDARRGISPFCLEALTDRTRFFKTNTKTREIMGGWSKDIFTQINKRNRTISKRVLLIRDIAEQDAKEVAGALSGGLIGLGWLIYWIGPEHRQAPESSALQKELEEVGAELKTPGSELSRMLLDLLENEVPRK